MNQTPAWLLPRRRSRRVGMGDLFAPANSLMQTLTAVNGSVTLGSAPAGTLLLINFTGTVTQISTPTWKGGIQSVAQVCAKAAGCSSGDFVALILDGTPGVLNVTWNLGANDPDDGFGLPVFVVTITGDLSAQAAAATGGAALASRDASSAAGSAATAAAQAAQSAGAAQLAAASGNAAGAAAAVAAAQSSATTAAAHAAAAQQSAATASQHASTATAVANTAATAPAASTTALATAPTSSSTSTGTILAVGAGVVLLGGAAILLTRRKASK